MKFLASIMVPDLFKCNKLPLSSDREMFELSMNFSLFNLHKLRSPVLTISIFVFRDSLFIIHDLQMDGGLRPGSQKGTLF